MSPVVRHALWVLVLIKFITPPVMTWPWHVPDPLGIQALDARVENRPAAPAGVEAAVNSGDRQAVFSEPVPSLKRSLSTPAAPQDSTPSDPSNVWTWLLAIWAVGAAAMLLVEAVRLTRIARTVRSARPADPRIIERVLILAARLDMRPVDVVAMPGATAPAMWCLGRPRLLWPAELPADFSDACIDGLIVHELAHIKRRDHIVGWIELGAGVIWWWNPLFWFVRSALREQAELACDGWVIAALPNGRRAYAESLLALSSAAIVDVPASPMSAVFGVRARSRRALERRLVMIMKGRASRRLSAIGLVGLGMMAAATLPVWATTPQQVTTTIAQQVPPPPPPATLPPAPPAAPTAAAAPAAPYPQLPPPPPRPATAAPAPPVAIATTMPPTPQTAPPAGTRPGVAGLPGTAPPAPAQTASARPGAQGQTVAIAPARDRSYVAVITQLPAEVQSQVKSYESERDALQQELEKKMEAKRADLRKSLLALQESYTKAGKLDEAVAVRDYIRSLDRERDLRVRIAR
jgi:beta-lactamase regulating signal transducer with metallopeptidase domain